MDATKMKKKKNDTGSTNASSSSNSRKRSRPVVVLPRQLMFQSVHGLNPSYGKVICVGLQRLPTLEHRIVVSIIGDRQRSICLSEGSWLEFVEDFVAVAAYMTSNILPDGMEYVKRSNYRLHLTTSYNEKAISIEDHTDYSDYNSNNEDSAFEEAESPKEEEGGDKWRPCVVLQRGTFENLMKLEPCVTARIQFLHEISKLYDDVKSAIVECVLENRENVDYENAIQQALGIRTYLFFRRKLIYQLVTSKLFPVAEHKPLYYDIIFYEILITNDERIVHEVSLRREKT